MLNMDILPTVYRYLAYNIVQKRPRYQYSKHKVVNMLIISYKKWILNMFYHLIQLEIKKVLEINFSIVLHIKNMYINRIVDKT